MGLTSFFKLKLRNYKREIVSDVLLEMVKHDLTERMLRSVQEKGTVETSPIGQAPLVVSLTTHGRRIYDVYLVIESLMRQTVKANRILLWLDEKEFQPACLPQSLLRQTARGLEIRFCPNYRSYTKIVPTLKAFPEAAIVTVDDDTLYPYDMLEGLVEAYRRDPACIYFHRGNFIRLDADGNPLLYEQWGKMRDNELQDDNPYARRMWKKSAYAFPTGVGGVLYPPHSLHPDTTDERIFLELCPRADDLWLKLMALKQGTPAALVYSHLPYAQRFLTLPDNQDLALMHSNVGGGISGNDRQLRALLSHYRVSLSDLMA